jgi:hypothetical protein
MLRAFKKICGAVIVLAAFASAIGCNQPFEIGDAAGSRSITAPSSWTNVPTPPFSTGTSAGYAPINGVAWGKGTGNGVFVAVSGTGAHASTSVDGVSWNPPVDLPEEFTRAPSVVHYLNGNFLATAGNSVTVGAISTDNGVSWKATPVYGVGTKGASYGDFEGSELYVLTGQSGTAIVTPDLVNGPFDKPATTFGTAQGPQNYINVAAYGNGIFVIGGGSGHTAYSIPPEDEYPLNWETNAGAGRSELIFNSSSTATDGFINGLAFGNEVFVAVGGVDDAAQAAAAWSTDGSSWTAASNFPLGGTDQIVKWVTFGNGYFVAGDSAGKIAYSTNGVSWTLVSYTLGGPVNAIAFGTDASGNPRVLAVGGEAGTPGTSEAAYSTP